MIQYNFRDNWETEVAHHLVNQNSLIWDSLESGLQAMPPFCKSSPLYHPKFEPHRFELYRRPEPPYLYGSIEKDKPAPQPMSLDWFTPADRCAYINPFVFRIAQAIFGVQYRFALVRSLPHCLTVAYPRSVKTLSQARQSKPLIVFDILNCEDYAAEQSLTSCHYNSASLIYFHLNDYLRDLALPNKEFLVKVCYERGVNPSVIDQPIKPTHDNSVNELKQVMANQLAHL